MSKYLNDGTRTAFMQLFINILSMAVLFGLELDAEKIAAIQICMNLFIGFLMMLVKTGQSDPVPTTGVRKVRK